MAELHRVEINEKAPREIEPEERQRRRRANPKRNYRKTKATARNGSPKSSRVRRIWRQAYAELEKKLGQAPKEDTEESEQVEEKAEDETKNKLKRTLVKRTKQLRRQVKSSLKTTVNLVRKLITL